MKKRIISIMLALAILFSISAMPSYAAGTRDFNPAEHYFYDQLTRQGKVIYNALLNWFEGGGMKDGQSSFDLAGSGSFGAVDERATISQDVIKEYLNGNRTLFNDFAAAKDAFDLEHPEAWYVDSAYLSFRVTSDSSGKYHAYMGPGRSDNYYVQGVTSADDVDRMTGRLERMINDIADGVSGSIVEQIRYVHEQITKSISYRFENECTAGNAGYIRTAYALVTHQGVCEGYARSFQWVLNELGIPCVLIHGVQTSGVPENHMWTAVQIGDEWYVVDPTWDDPVPLDKDGNIKQGRNGLDGGEHETYLLVGQDVTAKNWQPSGYVSTGAMEFKYPDIALQSYGKDTMEKDGLKVVADENSRMEDTSATTYTVSFNGMGVQKAAEQGYYFLVKMYDLNADGSMDAFDDWYYPQHMLLYYNWDNSSNPYFYDSNDALTMTVSQAEYVEFAITTTPPPNWRVPDDLITLGGYYSGNGADILAESGLIFNTNGGYEAPPYVKNVSPLFSTSVYVGETYTVHMEFTDLLYKPTQADIDNAPAGKLGDLESVVGQEVKIDYTGTTYSWGVNARLPHVFAQKPPVGEITWLWDCERTHRHSLDAGCRVYGLEYEFSASKMWADDSIQYEFSLYGLVGTKSNKAPSSWSYVFENRSAHCSYRVRGIDWNLWGQPQLLDNPNDLDLSKMVTEGVTGQEQSSLEELRKQMHLDDADMNGRIMLVVEDLSANRSSSEELSTALSDRANGVDVPTDAIKASSMYEIDFARICRQTIVKTGQSLRLSIGFPPGFDASMEGIVFKAYHFTRDIEGSCDIKDSRHTHTGLVTSVQELKVTVTQYGLVVLCDSFSPFEIVAIDTSIAKGIRDTSLKNTVTLVNDGYGTVESTGTPVKDAYNNAINSMIQIPDRGRVTFTIRPNDGYELDTITFSGKTDIEVNEDNTFTLSASDLADVTNGNAILSVTFVPKTIHEAEEKNGETVVSPSVCNHENTRGAAYLAPSCTKNGHTEGKSCVNCGQVLSVSETISATGHSYKHGVCTRCGEEKPDEEASDNSDNSQKPALPPVYYADVPINEWYYEAVQFTTVRGMMQGTGDGFSPMMTTTRGMIVTILARLAGVNTEGGAFWYEKGNIWAMTHGVSDGSRPEDVITREELAHMMYCFMGSPDVSGSLSRFSDASNVSEFAADAMLWAVQNGIIEGTDLGTLNPGGSTTRAEAATMLTRFCKAFDL